MADDSSDGPARPANPPAPAAKPEPERAEAPKPVERPRSETQRTEPRGRDPRDRDGDGRDDQTGDRLTETIRQKLEQLVPDLVKKTFAAGMGAVFTTEEGIRRVVGGARDSLPEVAGYIASGADSAKDRVFEIIARETREFLSNLNLTEEIAKLLTTLSFEIKTEIRFIPNSERITGAEPDVKASVRLKKSDAKFGSGSPPRGAAEADRKDEDAGRDSRSRLRFWRRDEGGAESDEDDDHEK